MVSAKREEKDVGRIDLRLRKVIERFCLTCGVGIRMSMLIARWSELGRMLMVMPVEQTSVCPFLWVGKSTETAHNNKSFFNTHSGGSRGWPGMAGATLD